MLACEKYKINPKEFSEKPVALCVSFRGEPNENCDRGDGKKYCYCKLPCSSQTKLDGSNEMFSEMKKVFDEALKKGE